MHNDQPIPNFAEVARVAIAKQQVLSEPVPPWGGIATLFGAPTLTEADVGVAVLGIPFDSTSSSRPGASAGPRAVRAASLIYASSLASRPTSPMVDMRNMSKFEYVTPDVIDRGDVSVFPTDPVRTYEAVSRAAFAVCSSARTGVFLHGDHSTTFASFAGFRAAREGLRLGFINIDHHFDFGTWSSVHGPLYHGSNSRRISELPGMTGERMAFIGVGDVTRAEQLNHLRSENYGVSSAGQIRRDGIEGSLLPIFDRMRESCDEIYLSVDIDVLDGSVAPGTGNVTIGGLDAGMLLDVVLFIRDYLPIGAIDIAEVNPSLDPSGRTAQIAARLLFEFLFRSETVG